MLFIYENESIIIKLRELCGTNTLVYLLTEDKKLVSFCTLAEQDDVRNLAYTPWIGFVYTFPDFRGHRYVGQLIERRPKKMYEPRVEHLFTYLLEKVVFMENTDILSIR